MNDVRVVKRQLEMHGTVKTEGSEWRVKRDYAKSDREREKEGSIHANEF